MNEQPTIKRNRVKHALTLEERLLEASRKARDTARKLPPGKERAMLLRSARESEAAAQINKLDIAAQIEASEIAFTRASE